MRTWFTVFCVLFLALSLLTSSVLTQLAHAAPGPRVAGNFLVDQDHDRPFPQNASYEPALTRDPLTGVLIAAAIDGLQQQPCTGTTKPLTSPCPFKPGSQSLASYRSTDNGRTWTGAFLPGFPSIGENATSDPSLDYGPRRCADGRFRFSCGVAIYYAGIASPFPAPGAVVDTVSRSYDDGLIWSDPVIATSTNRPDDFNDHPWVAVDHSPSSPYFGRVYLFFAYYCFASCPPANNTLYVVHSDDEGRSWSPGVALSSESDFTNLTQGFLETGQMVVASNGTVEAFWPSHANATAAPSNQVVAISTDGGQTFSTPITIAPLTPYPFQGTPFDGIDGNNANHVPGMSARADCYPHPAADPHSSRVYVVWCDFSSGQGVIKGAVSLDGRHWQQLGTIASVPGRNAFFPQISVSPTGIISLSFDALTMPPADQPWQLGVQVYDMYYTQSHPGRLDWSRPLRVSTVSSNPDGTSHIELLEQFIGDYTGMVSGPTSAYIVWTDARHATPCPAVDAYDQAIYAGSQTAIAPNPDTACALNFGNSDTELGIVNY